MNSAEYITNGHNAADDLTALREHPLIQDFASMSDDTYELVEHTNPTLKLLVDMARTIINGGVGRGGK